MCNRVKDKNMNMWTHYFFNDIIDIEIFYLNNFKIVEKSYKNILFNILDMWQSKNS